jgi:hypothetical protein
LYGLDSQSTTNSGTDLSQSLTTLDTPLQLSDFSQYLQPTPGAHHHFHSFLQHIFQAPTFELQHMAQPQVADSNERQQAGCSRYEETNF